MSGNAEVCLRKGGHQDWLTPLPLFKALDAIYHFTVDIAADENNHLCQRYFSEKYSFFEHYDLLTKEDVLFCNPPYGKGIIKWVRLLHELSDSRHIHSVVLVPARVDTRWFHEYVYRKDNVEYTFVRGRLNYGNPVTGSYDQPAAFPSMLIKYGGQLRGLPYIKQN